MSRLSGGFVSPNHTQVPNDLFDLMPTMQDCELRVTLAAIRITLGFHRERQRLSLTRMQAMTGLSRPSVLRGAEAAEARGTLRRVKDGRVTVWEIVWTATQRAEGGKADLPIGAQDGKSALPANGANGQIGKTVLPAVGKPALPNSVKPLYRVLVNKQGKEIEQKQRDGIGPGTSAQPKRPAPRGAPPSPAEEIYLEVFKTAQRPKVVDRARMAAAVGEAPDALGRWRVLLGQWAALGRSRQRVDEILDHFRAGREPVQTAAEIYARIAGKGLVPEVAAQVNGQVGDDPKALDLWRKIVSAWVMNGWNSRNLAGMLDCWQRREVPTRKAGGRNGGFAAGRAAITHGPQHKWEPGDASHIIPKGYVPAWRRGAHGAGQRGGEAVPGAGAAGAAAPATGAGAASQ